jgi:predicted SnoaL-like aldol condensation-catalyzing enzyme
MAQSGIEKVSEIFAGIRAGDVDLATRYIDHKRFLQHNPHAAEGVAGLVESISQAPRDQLQLTIPEPPVGMGLRLTL